MKKKWVPDNKNLNPSSEETQTIQCLITVFILATLFISSLGSKGLCYGYLKIQETNKTNIQS